MANAADSSPPTRGITAREHWLDYAAGMLTEAGFILALTVIALLMAIVAKAVF